MMWRRSVGEEPRDAGVAIGDRAVSRETAEAGAGCAAAAGPRLSQVRALGSPKRAGGCERSVIM